MENINLNIESANSDVDLRVALNDFKATNKNIDQSRYISCNLDLEFNMSHKEVLDVFLALMDSDCTVTSYLRKYVSTFALTDSKTLIYIVLVNDMPFDQQRRTPTVCIYSEYNVAKSLYASLYNKYCKAKNQTSIKWYFSKADGKLEHSTFYISDDQADFSPEFYPYIENLNAYAENFNKSTANVLVLLGPPGTGKTHFIKHLLRSTEQNAITTYDEKVMMNDELYITFLNSFERYLILEDSDLLLLSRERDNNKVMSKILNASNGLIKLDKKFVFSANISHESQIDEALIRPGRCFDVLKFRNLTRHEAQSAASTLNKILAVKDEYSLAEIFNGNSKTVERKFGF